MINGANDFGPFTEFRYTGKIRVIFQSGNRVTGVETTGRGDRTARNEGVGSRLAAVRNQVAGVSCRRSRMVASARRAPRRRGSA